MSEEGKMLYDTILLGSYYPTNEPGIIRSDYLFLKTGAIQIDVSSKWPINKAIYDRAIDDRKVLTTLQESAYAFIDSISYKEKYDE